MLHSSSSNGLGSSGETPFKQRLSRDLAELSCLLAETKGGALCQVWMPEATKDGSTVLSAQGLPYAVAGVGDLLALFRCVSVRYRFGTSLDRPQLMGAPGRVFATTEPEMSRDVQKYDKQIYLRVTEAQRCRVHSTMVMPVYEVGHQQQLPLAVFEVIQSDKDVVFPALLTWLRQCLEGVKLSTCSFDKVIESVGLRNLPGQLAGARRQQQLALLGSSDMRQDHAGSVQHRLGGLEQHMIECAADAATPSGDDRMDDAEDAEKGSSPSLGSQGSQRRDNLQRLTIESDQLRAAEAQHEPRPQTEATAGLAAETTAAATPGPAAAAGQASAPGKEGQAQLLGWMQQNGLGPEAVQLLKSLLTPGAGAKGEAGGSAEQAAAAAQQLPPGLQQIAQLQAAAAAAGGKQVKPASKPDRRAGGDEDDDDDDIGSSGGESDDSGDEGRGRGGNNRVGGGAGKRLRFEDLQSQFGKGLKEAANNLGICATTLKRACRRLGIKRWPRRQIAKLSKALHQMGYQGGPPAVLVQSAVTGKLMPGDAAPQPQQQQAQQLQQAQQAQQLQQGQQQVQQQQTHFVQQQLQQQLHQQQQQQQPVVQMQAHQQVQAQLPGSLAGGHASLLPSLAAHAPNPQGALSHHAHVLQGLGMHTGMHLMGHPQGLGVAMQQQQQQQLLGLGLAHAGGGMAGVGMGAAHAAARAQAPATNLLQQHQQQLLHQQHQQQQMYASGAAANASAAPYAFMLASTSSAHNTGPALVNELEPRYMAPGAGMGGAASMTLDSSSLLINMHEGQAAGNGTSMMMMSGAGMGMGMHGQPSLPGRATNSDMHLMSGISLPDLLDNVDVTMLAGRPNINSSHAHIAAAHELFKNAPGSVEGFLELLSDDLFSGQ